MIVAALRALGVVGGLALIAVAPTPTYDVGAAADPVISAPPTAAADAPVPLTARTLRRDRATVRPTQLRIPAIGVRSGLDSITVDSAGVLARPPNWNDAAWFSGASVPGQAGPAVIAGHVDSPTGPAVFWRLRELHPGDAIVVALSDASSATFTVTAVKQYAQTAFPTEAVYGATPGSELRLITCAGTYDHAAHRYRDNMVVYAVLR